MRESVAIADACFDRLLEIARIGITEREIGAAMYERCYALGGEDPLFLSMYPESNGGRAEGRFGPPVDRVLERGEQLVVLVRARRAHGLLDGVRAHGRVRRADRAAAAHERRRDRGARGRRRADAAGQAAGRGAGRDHERGRRARRRLQLLVGARDRPGRDRGAVARTRDRAGPDRPLDLGARRGHGAREPSVRRRPRRAGRGLHGRHVPRHPRGRQGLLAEAPHALHGRRERAAGSHPRGRPAAPRARDHAGDGDGPDALVALADLQRDRRPRDRRVRRGGAHARADGVRLDHRERRRPAPADHHRALRREPARRRRDHPQRRLHRRQPERRRRHLRPGLRRRRAGRVDGEQGPRRRHRRHDAGRLRPERPRGLAGGVPHPAAQARRAGRACARTCGS